MRKIFYTIVLISPLLFIGCDEDENNTECNLSTQGTVVDYTGFDGCSVLVKNDTQTFEVINWVDMNFIPQDGMDICFDYTVEDGWASICMMGLIITITDCQVLE